MKTKIFGLALLLTLSTVLGACNSGTESTPGASPGVSAEPTDTGSPAATTSPSTTTTTSPEPTTTTSPSKAPGATPSATPKK